jgi:hypothetical protein
MNPMNRRQFLSVLGGASAISMAIPAFASSTYSITAENLAPNITSLYVRGLVMVDLGNPDLIRLGFPKAPGHRATLSVVAPSGTKQALIIKGNGSVEAKGIASSDAKIVVPELIRMREFYGNDVKSHVDKCPGVISIPRNAIRAVTASELTPSRYTFLRTDTGEEVTSFRPRQVADAIRIDLSSAGTLKLDDGKINIPLETARELRVEYTAEKVDSADPFADHFHHYFPYVERPAALDFDVVPRKVSALGDPAPAAVSHAGHHFLDDYILCSLVAVP